MEFSRPQLSQTATVIQIGCNGSIDQPLEGSDLHVRRSGNCQPQADSSRSDRQRKFVSRRIYDCHRDVRTHRVGGIMLKHRHVGEDCTIREVQNVN